MTTIALNIIERVAANLLDTDYVRWSLNDHLTNLNSAESQIVFFKPTSNTLSSIFQLVQGTRQDIPDDAIELVRITRYCGIDGETDGDEILPATLKDMDELLPGWRTDTANAQPIHSIFNDQDRKKFDVYPPQPDTDMGYIEAICSFNPTPLTSSTDLINLGDEYVEPIVNYMMFAAYSRDTASSMYAAERAVAHWNLFLSQVGRKDLIEQQYPKKRQDQYGNTSQSVS
jgi:hypothetical protein